VGNGWINSIYQARGKLELAFRRYTSLRAKSWDRENIQTAWEVAISNLIRWFEKPHKP
jgi:DNA-binding FadR family transcriptional regulator